MRLDIYLTENGFASTRSKAQQLIKEGMIKVDDKIIVKSGFEINNQKVDIIENEVLKYVSRGGHKLQKAIDTFGLNFKDKVIVDIGSSTGGFTDCSLKYGAKKVYAIDVGTSQLHESLRNREDVIIMENTNFKDVTKDTFSEKIDFYVCDVSFISIRFILNTLLSFHSDFEIILLFKPQFEIGKVGLNKKGVVKNKSFLKESLNDFVSYLKEHKLNIIDYSFSPILGNKEGNIEFLFYLSTSKKGKTFLVNPLLDDAINSLKPNF